MAITQVGLISYPYCQKVLPLVYDDSLSYYENICKFVVKLNEMAEAINNISVDILEQANQYTDSKVASVVEEVNAKVAELQYLIETTKADFERILKELNDDYIGFKSDVDAQLVIFNAQIQAFDETIKNDIKGVNARTDLAIKQNNDYIFEVIGEQLLGDIKVINPFTGAKVSIQDMIYYLANLHTDLAATINFIMSSDKTVNQIVAIDADCTDWVLNGRTLLS